MTKLRKKAPGKPKEFKWEKRLTKTTSNKVRHGLSGSALPKGCTYIYYRCNSLRRLLEEQLLQLKGEVNMIDASAINSIIKWERHGLLAAHWLRHEMNKLSPPDRLKFSEAIAKASDNRDRCIRKLGLDVKPEPWNLSLPAPSTEASDDNS